MRDDRGFALVAVLWLLVILTLLAGMAMQIGRTATHLERNVWNRLELEAAAESAIAQAILSLLDDRPTRRWPMDGRPTELTVNGIRLVVRIQDELGRIDLNTASRDLIAAYLVSSGAGETAGGAIADRILRWRETDQQRQLRSVADQDIRSPNAGAPEGPFHNLEDLQRIPGMTPALFERTKSGFTIYSRRPNVDRAVAPRSVLLSLPGMTTGAVDELMALRTAGRPADGGSGNAIGAPLMGRAFAISVSLDHNDYRYELTRVVKLLPAGKPYWVLYTSQ